MNAKQLIEHLKTSGISIDEFGYEDYDKKVLDLGEIEEVEQQGGENQGSNWFSVKHFKDHNVFLQVSGYYSSYSGVDFDGWDDVIEVVPKEKTITVYTKI